MNTFRSGIEGWVRAWIARGSDRDDPRERAIVLRGNTVLATLGPVVVGYAVLFWLWPMVGLAALLTGVAVMMVVARTLFVHTRFVRVAGHLFPATVLGLWMGASFATGMAPRWWLPWFVLAPLMALFVVGYRAGWVWCVLTAVMLIPLAVADAFGVGVSMSTPPLAFQFIDHATFVVIVAGFGVALQLQARRRFVELQRRQHEIAERGVEVAAAHAEAVAASAATDEFLARVAREVRAPLTTVLGNAELVRADPTTSDEVHAQADVIRSSAGMLATLIDDIVDTARIEAGLIAVSPTPTAVEAVVADVVQLFEGRARKAEVALGVCYDTALPRRILLDGLRLRQVLANLVGNALKFTPAGGSVTVHAASDGALLRLSVDDTGCGISPEACTRLFEEYTQADSSTQRTYGGTGLGLSICRRLVEAMGGEIGVDSTVGSGSSFWMSLPLAVADEADDAVAPRRVGADAAAMPNVLVVDDDPDHREVAAALARSLGSEVSVAFEPEAVLARVMRGDVRVVLMDVHMPGVDGPELTRRIRATGEIGAGVRVVGVTTATTADETADCRAAGMDAILLKPFTSASLERVLRGGDAAERWSDDAWRSGVGR